ncbi:NAD-dependent epimerase/dehydratase family protein [Halomarina rubra]|uniref:NAD-dependent epimerase/dehydratase family protein n=1 Tax=Halomarina rubra TaxID=2071873 RepID=A0ABD6AZ05_9EURY
MTVLVVGASGYLGRSVVDALRAAGQETAGTHFSNAVDGATHPYDFFESDLRDLPLGAVDAVVFAAHVERTGHPFERFATAAEGFVDAVRDAAVRLVYVSSAGVFDGSGTRYTESVDPTPKSRYGRRLRRFERCVATLPDACAFRADYLFGHSRGVLDERLSRTRRLVRAGQTVPYYADMWKSPCHVQEAGRALAVLSLGDARGVVHAPTPRTSAWAFHRAGMAALGEDARLVVPEPMPEDPTLHRDSSLASDRFEQVCGFRPRSVTTALREPHDSASPSAATALSSVTDRARR